MDLVTTFPTHSRLARHSVRPRVALQVTVRWRRCLLGLHANLSADSTNPHPHLPQRKRLAGHRGQFFIDCWEEAKGSLGTLGPAQFLEESSFLCPTPGVLAVSLNRSTSLAIAFPKGTSPRKPWWEACPSSSCRCDGTSPTRSSSWDGLAMDLRAPVLHGWWQPISGDTR